MSDTPADETRHASLSRAHSIGQTELSAFLAPENKLLPIRDTGYEVREVDARSALTRCALPGEPWSLNPYMGCSHDCVYCYVPDVAHVERPRWGSYVVVKRNLPTVLARELKRKERKEVFLSSATDPYQPAEGVHRVTRRCLEVLLRTDWPVRVLSRNPLLRRDIDLFTRFDDFEIGMSVPTLDDRARRVLEPGAPPIAGRLATLRELADVGLRPYANLAPAYPFTSDIGPRETAAAFKEAGVAVVFAGRWRYLGGVLPALRERVDGTLYERFTEAVQVQGHYDRMFTALAAAFRREGVRFEEMGGLNWQRRRQERMAATVTMETTTQAALLAA